MDFPRENKDVLTDDKGKNNNPQPDNFAVLVAYQRGSPGQPASKGL